jgi:hypothetical protein
MFKIMPNAARQFSLTEILLVAAMNQVEARQRAPVKMKGRHRPVSFHGRVEVHAETQERLPRCTLGAK